ncbi:hypothetical protein EIP91_004747 [Steccherinum ochraceum]|uniref:HNH nuclease domain-containing protein n=1 Tax=Steccherinum ochraceum TaxID=92696 RepID=A0A4V2MVX2_9APHY|nr:hypothetical protein EIP91_004747 [Steccherinum ochraceum]
MSHNQSSSDAAPSICFILHKPDFHASTLELEQDETQDTSQLWSAAHAMLDEVPIRPLEIGAHTLSAVNILKAMLNFAYICDGQRYVAAAILAAGTRKVQETVYNETELTAEEDIAIQDCYDKDGLYGLAFDWLQLLLWPFKRAYKSLDEFASEHSSPTFESAENKIDPASDSKPSILLAQTLKRDGFRCIMSCMRDVKSIQAGHTENVGVSAHLEAAHILRRSIFTEKSSASSQPPATIDILKHFARLSDDAGNELTRSIDTLENMFMLQSDWHKRFDAFDWCLIPDELDGSEKSSTEQWCTLKSFLEITLPGDRRSDRIVFKNNASPDHDLKVPNPKYLAIHAAITHVLHMSGAGRVLNLIADDSFPSASAALSRPSSSVDFGGADLALRSSVLSLMASLRGTP